MQMHAILNNSSYEEQQHLMPSHPPQIGLESEPGLMATHSDSKKRPGTSMFYEPSANKNESGDRVGKNI